MEATPYLVAVNDLELIVPTHSIIYLLLLRKHLKLENKIQIKTMLGDLFSEAEINKLIEYYELLF